MWNIAKLRDAVREIGGTTSVNVLRASDGYTLRVEGGCLLVTRAGHDEEKGVPLSNVVEVTRVVAAVAAQKPESLVYEGTKDLEKAVRK